jgi:hypothetical protein
VITRQATVALVRKELRELLPLWAVTMAGLALAGVSGVVTPAILFFTPAAVLGTLAPIALGAMAMGHEYRHRTLTTLLSLPVNRRNLLAAKAAVLGVLLFFLAAAAWWVGARTPWLLLPLALGFCLAPWFTLLTRSELAGMVFACAMPALLLLVAELVADEAYGNYLQSHGAAYLQRTGTVGIGTAVLCAIAVADTARRFLSLEVIDGSQRVSSLPSVVGVRAAAVVRRPTNVYVALLKKELRLQTLPIVVAAVFGLCWWSLQLLSTGTGETSALVRTGEVLLPLFALLLAMLSGALASADERHLGVWAPQVLLPVPMWRQWIVKVAVVLGLAFTFALVFVDLEATQWRFGYWVNVSIWLPSFVAGAAALSLYVSSISKRGVVALLVSAGAVCLWMLLATILASTSGRWAFGTAWQAFYDVLTPGSVTSQTATVVRMAASRLLLMFPVVVLVWLALKNHRRLDHPARMLRWQIAAIVVVTIVSVAGTPIAFAFEDAVFSRNRRPRVAQMAE